MPVLDRGDVHVDKALTNVSRKLAIPEMIAMRIFPMVNVGLESDVYHKIGREELRDQKDRDLRADGTEASTFHWKPRGTDSYVTQERALKDIVTDRVVKNADAAIMPRMRTTNKLTKALQTQHEIRVSDLMFDTAVVPSAAVGTFWDDPAADIEEDVKDAKELVRKAIGMKPNTIVLSEEIANHVVTFLKASAEISIGERISLFEMPTRWLGLNVLVGGAQKDTADEESAESLESIWPDTDVWIGYVNPGSVGLDDFSFGWSIINENFNVRSWRDEPKKGNWIEVSWNLLAKRVVDESGFILEDVLA